MDPRMLYHLLNTATIINAVLIIIVILWGRTSDRAKDRTNIAIGAALSAMLAITFLRVTDRQDILSREIVLGMTLTAIAVQLIILVARARVRHRARNTSTDRPTAASRP